MRALTAVALGLLIVTPAWAGLPEAGQTGYGLSVFEGEEPRRFQVEILGTLHGFGGTGNLILGLLRGEPLEHTGVLQGMSGSPVWIDGELIGAVMSTWAFAKDAIAGIRPIDEMRPLQRYLDEGAHPGWTPGQSRVGAPPPEPVSAPFGFALPDLLEPDSTRPERAALGRALGATAPGSGLLWIAAGFPASVQDQMQEVLGTTVAPAGVAATASGEGRDLAPGDAMAAVLVDGDARLAAVGTVTAVEGATVLGFGHPFLGRGPVSIPLARARVVALLASDQLSFKMAEATEVVGALLLDRRTGVSGKLGVTADTLPVSVTVEPAVGTPRGYEFEVARVHSLLPNLVAWSVQSALLDQAEVRPESAVRVAVEVELANEPPLRTEATLSGTGLGRSLVAEVSLPVGLTQFNQERPVRIERVGVELRLEEARQTARLGQVRVSTRRPEPGSRLGIEAELLPYRGAPTWVAMELTVPATLAPGPLRLHLVDGGAAFREELARALPRWSYPGFAQIRDALSLREPASSLVAVLYTPSQSVVVRGVELERLPPTVRQVLGRQRAQESGVGATPVARTVVPTSWVLDATRHLALTVPTTD